MMTRKVLTDNMQIIRSVILKDNSSSEMSALTDNRSAGGCSWLI
jgi:hypothetical protein